MATCRDCKGRPGKFIAAGYCEVCGFGFISQNGEFLDVTCLRTHGYKMVVAGGPPQDLSEIEPEVQKTPPPVMEKLFAPGEVANIFEATKDHEGAPGPAGRPPAAIKASNAVPGEIDQGLLEVIKKHGPAGKARILELHPMPEDLWPIKIKALLAAKLVIQEGERRGAKYKGV